MIDLDSSRWGELCNPELESSVPNLLKRLARRPTHEDWQELWEQTCHQWTRHATAFAATPHIVVLGRAQGIAGTWEFVYGLGRIAVPASGEANPPEDLREEFECSLDDAARIAIQATLKAGCPEPDFPFLLQGTAALHRRRSPGLLMDRLHNEEFELDCPHCDRYLLLDFTEEPAGLIHVDERCQPQSDRLAIRPREMKTVPTEELSPSLDNFVWLCSVCVAAAQERALHMVCCLYGEGTCPLCGQGIRIIDAVERAAGITS